MMIAAKEMSFSHRLFLGNAFVKAVQFKKEHLFFFFPSHYEVLPLGIGLEKPGRFVPLSCIEQSVNT